MVFKKWCQVDHAACLGIFLLIFDICFAEKAPFTSFAKEATLAAPIEYYDYIVIGGGTAGCALAATLSTSANVLVLERGGLPYDNPNVTHITGYQLSLADTSRTSAAQQFVSTDGVFNRRGRILGGSSAINGGLYSHAEAEFIRDMGWGAQLVNESYEWVERKLVVWPRVRAWQAAVRDGLVEAGVLPYRGTTYEHLVGTKVAGTIFDEHGYRHTAADLLEYADPTRIIVYLHATVHQILTRSSTEKKPKAYGVFFKDSKGAKHMAYLKDAPLNEVILSAGAIGSPQLLLLSGIGPTEELKALGINVILDQPMVGKGMSDNPMNAIAVPSVRPVEFSITEVVGITDFGSYIETTSGFFGLDWADPMPQNYTICNKKISPKNIGKCQVNHKVKDQVGIIMEKVSGPYSKGHLELKSLDPNDNPRVTFNYFQDHRDLQRCVQGMKIVKKVVESQSLSSFRFPFISFETYMNLMVSIPNNLRKKHWTTSYSLDQFCIDTVMTIWHYHGGCQVHKVVDHDYKVIGMEALRVIDGSTFHDSPGTNPQATVMMLARYMGQKILQGRDHG